MKELHKQVKDICRLSPRKSVNALNSTDLEIWDKETKENDENKISRNEENSIDYELLLENQSADQLKQLVEKFEIGNSYEDEVNLSSRPPNLTRLITFYKEKRNGSNFLINFTETENIMNVISDSESVECQTH